MEFRRLHWVGMTVCFKVRKIIRKIIRIFVFTFLHKCLSNVKHLYSKYNGHTHGLHSRYSCVFMPLLCVDYLLLFEKQKNALDWMFGFNIMWHAASSIHFKKNMQKTTFVWIWKCQLLIVPALNVEVWFIDGRFPFVFQFSSIII